MITKKCLNCGKEICPKFPLSPRNWKKRKFCSKKCHYQFVKGKPNGKKGAKHLKLRGKNHFNWKGGVSKHSGYILILDRNHPKKTRDFYVRRSHLVAEKILKRYLTKREVIHHINGIKTDDKPENLYLFPSHSKHMHYHGLNNKPILISNLQQRR